MGTKPVERRQTAPHRQLKTMASKAEKEATKVSKWDAAAVKNALDDAVKEVMKNKLAFPECHKLMDGRLLICSVAVAAAMFALLGFPQSFSKIQTCPDHLCFHLFPVDGGTHTLHDIQGEGNFLRGDTKRPHWSGS